MSLTFPDHPTSVGKMFAKVFSQIFDSSIARDYAVRHMFMDFLVLADREGVVDMTVDAISRRTNVPQEIVKHAIEELSKPDPLSRSIEEQGRRLVRLDSHRTWGWQIVNYDHYRNLVDEESRRAYFRDRKRDQRKRSKTSPPVQLVRDSPILSNDVTQAEAEADAEAEARGTRPSFEPDDFNQDPEANIPEGMTILQYAGFVLQQASIPAGYALKVKTGDTIELLAKDESCSLAEATRRLLERMRNAGPQKWNFWLQDGGWKQDAGMDATERAFLYGVSDD